MKAMKKILATLICLCLLLCCVSTVALAEEPKGSITIEAHDTTNAIVAGKTFELYKIFDATSDGTNTSYSWREGKLFYDFFFSQKYFGEKADGTITEVVNEIINYKKTHGDLAFSTMAADLYTYAKSNSIAYTARIEAGDAETVTFTDLSYGYYMIYDATDLSAAGNESFVRSAVMLNSVNSDVTIELKANRPQIEKTVKEHSGNYGEATSVSVGNNVSFKVSTLVPSHTHYSNYKYYIEDTLPSGFTYKDQTLKVQLQKVGKAEADNLLNGAGYDFTVDSESKKLKIDFTNYIDDPTYDFDIDDEILIYYDAVVDEEINRDSVNVNTATLTYSNDPATTSTGTASDSANVYSYMFVLTKFSEDANGNFSSHVRLDGAQFQIFRQGDTEPMRFIQETVTDGAKSYNRYVVAPQDATEAETVPTLEVLSGDVPTGQINNSTYLGGYKGDLTIFGLAEGTYEIKETKRPDGYILPEKPFVLTITDTVDSFGFVSDLDASVEHTGSGSFGAVGGEPSTLMTWAGIANQPGNTLPNTGGMGTTVFTVLGIVLMAGAVAFFTSRKRSSAV